MLPPPWARLEEIGSGLRIRCVGVQIATRLPLFKQPNSRHVHQTYQEEPMAFHITIGKGTERCDICKTNNPDRNMLFLSTTGHHPDQRNYIWMHLDCFERRLANAKKKLDSEPLAS
jgi:hypothetical protein